MDHKKIFISDLTKVFNYYFQRRSWNLWWLFLIIRERKKERERVLRCSFSRWSYFKPEVTRYHTTCSHPLRNNWIMKKHYDKILNSLTTTSIDWQILTQFKWLKFLIWIWLQLKVRKRVADDIPCRKTDKIFIIHPVYT